MARDAGANRVYFASAAPAVRYPNVYGIDMPAVDEFVAHGRSEDEIRREIGADRLIYQDLEDLIEAVRRGNPRLRVLDASCFDGHYVTGDIDQAYLESLGQLRCDAAKRTRTRRVDNVVDLHNAS
jgi:amidophosphoribosyltransferase